MYLAVGHVCNISSDSNTSIAIWLRAAERAVTTDVARRAYVQRLPPT